MRALTIAIATTLALGACVGDTTGTTTTPPASTLLPAPTSTSTVPDTTSTTTQVPGEVAVYFFFAGYPTDPGPWVVPVARAGGDGLEVALTSLLEGVSVTDAERGLSSAIPEGTRLLGVSVDDGIAAIDFSREFESGGGSLSVLGRVAQVVYTATRFDGVGAVSFLIEGTRVDVLSGEGLIVEEPQTREGYRDLIPAILVEEPLWGSTVSGQLTMSGLAQTESGTISYTVVDANGLIVAEGEITTTAQEWSAFQTVIEFLPTASPGSGSIVVFEVAGDGSQRHVLQYPLEIGG